MNSENNQSQQNEVNNPSILEGWLSSQGKDIESWLSEIDQAISTAGETTLGPAITNADYDLLRQQEDVLELKGYECDRWGNPQIRDESGGEAVLLKVRKSMPFNG